MSATEVSPFQIPPATNAYPTTIQVKLSYQIGRPLTGPSQRSDDIQPLLQKVLLAF